VTDTYSVRVIVDVPVPADSPEAARDVVVKLLREGGYSPQVLSIRQTVSDGSEVA
jgi:polyphosphate kinase